jgi:hypothetical protein
LCRNRWQMLQYVLPQHSLIVLGGSHGWWTAERRLARKLSAAGHHVIFSPDQG